jgi:hypothetical protein
VKRRALFAAVMLAAACAKPPPGPHGLVDRVFALPDGSRAAPTRSVPDLAAGIDALRPSIGAYPPRFADEADRERVYAEWCDLLLDANALAAPSVTEEQRRLLLGELYRMGHNLDVLGAAERADASLRECLRVAPRSIPCHRSNASFLLSTGMPDGSHLDRAEASLRVMREELGPAPDEGTEAGFVFLYVYRRDGVAAKKQVDAYLSHFPNGPRAEIFRKMRPALDRPIELREH